MNLFRMGIASFRHPCRQLTVLSILVLSYMTLYNVWDKRKYKDDDNSLALFFLIRFFIFSLLFSITFKLINSSSGISLSFALRHNPIISRLLSFLLIFLVIPPTATLGSGDMSETRKKINLFLGNTIVYSMLLSVILAIKWTPCITTDMIPVFLVNFLSHSPHVPSLFAYAMGITFVLFQISSLFAVLVIFLPSDLIAGIMEKLSLILIASVGAISVVTGNL